MEYRLNCQWCGLPFISNWPHTRFCGDNCAKLFSKQSRRQSEIDSLEQKISAKQSATLRECLLQKEILTSAEAAVYLGVCKTTVTRYTALGILPCTKLPGKNLYKKQDLDAILLSHDSSGDLKSTMKNDSSELTTVVSAARKYGVSVTALHSELVSRNVSPIQFAGFTYFKKSEIHAALKRIPLTDSPKPKTWASHEEIELKYGITRTQVTRMLRNLNIPSKRMDRITYFSMEHLESRKKEEEERFAELYYTVPQIAAKYCLTQQRIYKILHTYRIPHFRIGVASLASKGVPFINPIGVSSRSTKGVSIAIEKEPFDKVFGIPEFTL